MNFNAPLWKSGIRYLKFSEGLLSPPPENKKAIRILRLLDTLVIELISLIDLIQLLIRIIKGLTLRGDNPPLQINCQIFH